MAQIVTQLIVDASGAKLGVAEFTAAMDKAKRSAVDAGDATATSFERAQAKWTASLAKTDPVIKAQIAMEKDLARQREIGANAVKLGITTQDAAAAQLSKVTQQHQAYIATLGSAGAATAKFAGQTGLARHELINLSRQAQDVAVSLGSGQSFGTVLLQQGTQIADVFANSRGTVRQFFSQVASGAAALITPLTLAVTGTIALTAAAAALALQWDKVQVSSQRAISGAGARTGTSISDLNSFAAQNSGSFGTNMTTGLSEVEARKLGESFTATGDIVISRLKGMSDAVVGFANQTGQSMDEASKAMVGFATDPKKALDELAKTYGHFDNATRLAVDALVEAGDKTGAFNVIIDALSEKSKKAAENMGFLERAWRGITGAAGVQTMKPSGIDDQLAAARAKLSEAEASPFQGALAQPGLKLLRDEVAQLQGALDKVNAQKAAAEINKLSTAADGAVNAITPQLAQMEQLRIKIEELERAKAAGATSKYGTEVDNAALQAAQNQAAALRESQAEAARYNERVQEISESWGSVGQATALVLQHMQNQLPVAQAVGTAAQMRAQQQATINDLLAQGRTIEEATAIAAAQYALSKAEAVARAKRLVQASQDQLDLLRAAGTADEARIKSDIAYRNAIQQGATAAQAAVISANTLAVETERAADASQRMAENFEKAARAASVGSFGTTKPNSGSGLGFGNVSGQEHTSSYYPFGYTLWSEGNMTREQRANRSLGSGGGISGAIGASTQNGGSGWFWDQQQDRSPDYGLMQSLYDLKNAQTNDKSAQIANLNEFLAYVQTQPETIARDQQIVRLMNSIDQLRDSVDANTAASLNPLYTQGRSALAIGYYKAATGLEGVVQGSSGTDSVPVHMMLTPGERVSVTPPGKNNVNNRPIVQSPVQNVYMDLRGMDTNTARRSRRQAAQGFGQAAAAGR